MAALERRRGDHAGSRHFAIAHSNRQIRIERWRNKSDVALRTVVDFGLIVGSAFVLYRFRQPNRPKLHSSSLSSPLATHPNTPSPLGYFLILLVMDETKTKLLVRNTPANKQIITVLLQLIPFLERIEEASRVLIEIWICRSSNLL